MDPLDFLSGADDQVELADLIDDRRPSIARWCAAALAHRHPELQRFRGVKGRRAWEQDVDWMLRRLHAAIVGGLPGLGCSSTWLAATLAEREITADGQMTAALILQEGLLRHLGAAKAREPAARVAEALNQPIGTKLSTWL